MQLNIRDYNEENNAYTEQVVEIEELNIDHFSKAADILEREGKVTGTYVDTSGCGVCTVGALARAVTLPTCILPTGEVYFIGMHEWLAEVAYTPLANAFAREITGDPDRRGIAQVYDWSDRLSQEEVISTLRKFVKEYANEQEKEAS